MTTSASSASVSDLLNAANWEYLPTGTPSANLTAFKVNGQQLSGLNEADGFAASVWQDTATHQLIIGFEGTQAIDFNAVFKDPNFTINQVKSDIALLAGQVPQILLDAFNFVTQVVEPAAAKQGYSTSSILVTGHSLGADEAEYVASQTGLGGIAFEDSGLSASITSVGSGTNFISVVEYGDAFANYSSDINAEQPFAPTYVAHGGALPHYGEVVMIGDINNQQILKNEAVASQGDTGGGVIANLIAYGFDMLAFHEPESQAYSLGVTLNQTNFTEQTTGVVWGPGVWNVANDTISQFLTAAQANGDASLSVSQLNVASWASASSGPLSGNLAITLTSVEPAIDDAITWFEDYVIDPLLGIQPPKS